jgi:hypothetical protein
MRRTESAVPEAFERLAAVISSMEFSLAATAHIRSDRMCFAECQRDSYTHTGSKQRFFGESRKKKLRSGHPGKNYRHPEKSSQRDRVKSSQSATCDVRSICHRSQAEPGTVPRGHLKWDKRRREVRT